MIPDKRARVLCPVFPLSIASAPTSIACMAPASTKRSVPTISFESGPFHVFRSLLGKYVTAARVRDPQSGAGDHGRL